MLQLEWNNPRITLGDLEIYLSNYLGSNYDGMIVEGPILRIRTNSVLSTEQEDYIKNYFYTVNNKPLIYTSDGPKDLDGASISRVKAAKSGWTYHLTAPEFETSQIGSLYHKNVAGTDLNEAVVKYYDGSNVELSTQEACDSSCVKTVFHFEPIWDYEIIGGTIKTIAQVTEDVRVWVVAVPDVPAAYGGSKIMVQGVNLRFIDPNNGIEADGRAAKFMSYNSTYHTNKLQLIVKHPVGHKQKIMMAFEVYRS